MGKRSTKVSKKGKTVTNANGKQMRTAISEMKYKARRKRGNEYAKLKRLKQRFAGTGMVKLGEYKEKKTPPAKKTVRIKKKADLVTPAGEDNGENEEFWETTLVEKNNTAGVLNGARDINLERRKMLEDEVYTMELISEAAEIVSAGPNESTRKKWKERLSKRTSDWENSKEEFYMAFISSQAYVQNICSCCSLELTFYTKCKTCHKICCYECDQLQHSTSPFHQRALFSENHSQILLPTQFVDSVGKLFHQGKPI